ncbi:pleiotropic drug resistance protein 3 [Citrus clementina]|uniref:pleiotropic drug resistance protein 3 n=1 Tax=Citrus clementina TaxID=85681 RepID=UPI000CECF0B2|nr:pleiotropic drug resistance protein 3 [Citrus x clementina]
MAQLAGDDETGMLRIELAEIGRSMRSSFGNSAASFCGVIHDNVEDDNDHDHEERDPQWAAVDRLPSFERVTTALFDDKDGKRLVDITKLGAEERHMFIEKLIRHIENDNLRLLHQIKRRVERVGVQFPTVEVRFKNLGVEAECEVVRGKPLPTLWNATKSMLTGFTNLFGLKQEAKMKILKDVNGIIKPGRMTLLLGPPGCGKTTLLSALSGKLSHSLKVSGEVSYNGYRLDEFVPQKTSAYISQYDLHIAEMTVRETIDFSARCQGTGHRADILMEVIKLEKLAGIFPDPDVDAYMKAISAEGLENSLQTDYILKILGLDICADTMVGDPMRRGVSGGQKKRLTTGELIVGPTRALFMDEISNGLDSSTTFQIVSFLKHLVHITDATALISLLQPAPETFDLFDDVILMAEGKIVYHGPLSYSCKFFEGCGFRCPDRKGVADFLQEVISRKDQAQYWHCQDHPYSYVSVDQFITKFKACHLGLMQDEELARSFNKSERHKNAISFKKYSLTKWELLKTCATREFLLMKRNSSLYVFKSTQLVIIASVTMTVFLRSELAVDIIHANAYLGALFYALVILIVDGFPEMNMTISRLAVFYKHRDLCFYPAWAYAIPASILKVPLSLLESFVWTSLTYYIIGFSPEVGRFIRQFLLFFAVHLTSISLFRAIASIFRTVAVSFAIGTMAILMLLLFGGFIIPKKSMPSWLEWGFWVCPLTYGEIGLTVNEFLAPRWEKVISGNTTAGMQTLESRGLNFDSSFYWISIGALIGFTILFNAVFILALTFLKPPGKSRTLISYEKYLELQDQKDCVGSDRDRSPTDAPLKAATEPKRGKMILPFEPLTVTFEDLRYYVDIPSAMRKNGFNQTRLQLLSDISGTFRPGILTALMGVSGAGKTTLMDVLSGRKTGGIIEGDIRIGGYPKVQHTFARISGYCEQNDIHSPNITVEESIVFSAWLRLSTQIDSKTKAEFVNEVLQTIELDGIKDSLVGLPGVNGLSTEQRKRLTIAVELVANPSIIFMDEPTSGLDARAAATVMRAVKNVVETGRTVVCTIHQPSIDIFEAFDDLVLMKNGGRIIYFGPLGQHSCKVIEYFECIPGVLKIKDNYNPATWMLEVSSNSMETQLGVDFAQIYRESTLYQENKELVKQLSSPSLGSKDLHFPTHFPQNGWEQFKACMWKHNLSYWRNPSYNLIRIVFTCAMSLLFGILFWQKGKKIKNQQDVFNILGALFSAAVFFGIVNCSLVIPLVTTERTVLYRERFAGMYSPWAYSFAQVLVEVPYLFIQAVIYVIITYPMIGYHWSGYKIFWSFYGMFCNLLYFNYMGMLIVSLTPNIQVASILASSFYSMLNLFCGFTIPKPQIPKWWTWAYYLCPTSWVLKGMLSSQYGDIDKEISAFGKAKTVSAFLDDYFGFDHDFLGVVGIVLIIFPILFASLFAYFIGELNFQRR